jgi:hypothetical protein
MAHTEFDHTNMTVEWGFDDNHEWTTVLYGCSLCDVKPQKERFPDRVREDFDHSNCELDPCFGCKARGLLINTGDAKAGNGSAMTNKEWDNELNAYRQARAEGIQPAGTSMKAINEAYRASEAMGDAYNADTMINSAAVTEKSAPILKEMGQL